MQGIVFKAMNEKFTEWISTHNSEMKALCKKIILAAKASEAAPVITFFFIIFFCSPFFWIVIFCLEENPHNLIITNDDFHIDYCI